MTQNVKLSRNFRYDERMSTSEHNPILTPEHTQNAETATRVLRQFRIVFNAVKSHFRHVERSAGIGGAQVWALSAIQASPGIGTNDLARAMDVHQSTASNLVKTLMQNKLVEIIKAEKDKRAICLHITAAGSVVLANAPAPFSGVLPNALANIPLETLQSLERDLQELIVALDADESSAKTPLANL